ncbi:glucose-6-phosphate dehydrogenase [Geomonas sp. RF6]|uniref:glucose-6-phosphate dehydrogenase n=1 Tax=Geomonas sp. RF6 TaxID=2897342 RepID=UPI001E537EDA|nr:glucose-6-phosphate dehydrogenase [Geomonas sp. RF6]UFS69940.1 glucose-6-phosphate dehydrogenase [Geomonas sp. RF6]
MPRNLNLDPVVIVILGARGDLARRKLVPALYNLFLDRYLPDTFSIIGVSRKELSDEAYRQHLREAVDEFSRRGPTKDEQWNRFAANITYLSEDLSVPPTGNTLGEKLAEVDSHWSKRANRVYYLAIAPELFEAAARHLEQLGVCRDCTRDRIVIEKPFGRDLASARSLNRLIDSLFAESQIYRIDHYLGKETVQNILAFRFANSLFEPIWNRRYIDHVQITVAETVGVESRGEYYERAGALRDMVQNHLLQILCLVAMEPPVSFAADEVRNKKVDVLRAIRPIRPEEVHSVAVRGQYRRGEMNGETVPGYREEPGVAPDSLTETFAALKLFVENWRWQGVPFYLRTGKRLHTKASEVTIMFRPAPHQMFPSAAVESWQPNRMVIRIQPEEGIVTRIQVKQPGTRVLLGPAEMQFRYREAFRTEPPEAYETLLLDVIRADATLFMRADQVESAWSVISPILEVWDSVPPTSFPDYPAGSFGPESADLLIAKSGHSWVQPVVMQEEGVMKC